MSMVFLFRRVQCKYPMTRVETIEGLEDSIRLIESHWSFVASHIASHRSPSCVRVYWKNLHLTRHETRVRTHVNFYYHDY